MVKKSGRARTWYKGLGISRRSAPEIAKGKVSWYRGNGEMGIQI